MIRGGGIVEAGAGDDVVEGGPELDLIDGGPGDDILRGNGGNDELHDDEGSNRLEGGAGDGFLTTGGGHDTLIGGSGRDNLDAGAGDDTLRARDADSGCAHVTGPRRLVLHGLARTGARSARIVVSCSAARACSARVRVHGGRGPARVRIPVGARRRIPIELERKNVSVELVTPANGVLRATLDAARR